MRPAAPVARWAAALGVLIAAVLVGTAAGTGTAHAEGYRYWSFWIGEDTGQRTAWEYATEGPATYRPGDGELIGFRFAVQTDSGDAARPRGAAAFTDICRGTPPAANRKRVALVVDFGTADHAPAGEQPPKARTACARVAENAGAAEALASVAEPLRYDSNLLLCAIAGYPQTGCGEQISSDSAAGGGSGGGSSDSDSDGSGDDSSGGSEADGSESAADPATSPPSDAAAEPGRDDGPTVGLAAALAAVAALGAAAVLQARRRRRR